MVGYNSVRNNMSTNSNTTWAHFCLGHSMGVMMCKTKELGEVPSSRAWLVELMVDYLMVY